MSPTEPAEQPNAPTAPPTPGDVLHFLVDGLTHPRLNSGQVHHGVSRRGSDLVLTDRVIEATRDRNGDTWLDLLHDEAGQIAKFGRVVMAAGPAPAEMLPERGSVEFEELYREAYSAAVGIENGAERRQALDAVSARFGPRGATSRTLAHYGPQG